VSLDADFIPAPWEMTFKEADPASLDELLRRLENDEFDLVAVGRALIANPEWATLVRDGETSGLHSFRKEMLADLA
jgi:2,4-dienoyl-CoA reductase-like NADH-dependent reductase (Old Yellow Enzyme family)